MICLVTSRSFSKSWQASISLKCSFEMESLLNRKMVICHEKYGRKGLIASQAKKLL